jgi:bifunctional UDP-N-acetylglucosamine pyrophosphorylase/glucosamine-1-phosphate N-acetyltransferase
MNSGIPKMFHRVCGKEMISLVVDAAAQPGSARTIIVVSSESQAIKDILGEKASYVTQAEQNGSGNALLQAKGMIEDVETVVALNADVPLLRAETLASMLRLHREREACVTLLTACVDSPGDLGRVVRDSSGRVVEIVEYRDADEETRAITEVNGGVYCFRASWLWPNLAALAPSSNGEYYLTDVISAATEQGMVVESVMPESSQEILGVNTRVDLARAEAALRQAVRRTWMLSGVTMPDPASVYIDLDVELGQDTIVLPNTHISGRTRIGPRCIIGPNSMIDGSEIGEGCEILASVVEGATLDEAVHVGPFSHIRPGSQLESGVHIGNFAEVKKSRLGRGARSGHFSYLGDAEIGAHVNIGAGTVTCNYDGVRKHRTLIEDDAFIGSDSMLVAPVTIGARSTTGAGAVVTRDVPADSMAVGIPARLRPKRKGRS